MPRTAESSSGLLRFAAVLTVLLVGISALVTWQFGLLDPYFEEPPPDPSTLEPKEVSLDDESLQFFYMDWERGFIVVDGPPDMIPPSRRATVHVEWEGAPKGVYYVANLYETSSDRTVTAHPMDESGVREHMKTPYAAASTARAFAGQAEYLAANIALEEAKARRDRKRRRRQARAGDHDGDGKKDIEVETIQRSPFGSAVDLNKLPLKIPGQ